MHDNQRTKLYKTRSRDYAGKLLAKIRSYTMACSGCGKRRSPSLSTNTTSSTSLGVGDPVVITLGAVPTDMPATMDGKVLSQYIGGQGKAKHYYNGVVSGFPYKVVYGQYVYAHPGDVKDAGNMADSKLPIKIVPPAPPVTEVAAVERVASKSVQRKPVV
jgi:hypothetical protein